MNRLLEEQRKVVDNSFYFSLNEMQKEFEKNRYFGTITIVFQDGKIVLIREERTLKPGSFRISF